MAAVGEVEGIVTLALTGVLHVGHRSRCVGGDRYGVVACIGNRRQHNLCVRRCETRSPIGTRHNHGVLHSREGIAVWRVDGNILRKHNAIATEVLNGIGTFYVDGASTAVSLHVVVRYNETVKWRAGVGYCDTEGINQLLCRSEGGIES